MPVHYVQRGRGHGKLGSSHSMLFSSLESGIFCLKYGIEEFLSQVIFWNVLDNSRDCTISGGNRVMHFDVYVKYY